MAVDLFSASAIVAVHDALESEADRAKFLGFAPVKMASVAFQLLHGQLKK